MSLVLSVNGSGSVLNNLLMPVVAEGGSLTMALVLAFGLTLVSVVVTVVIRQVQVR